MNNYDFEKLTYEEGLALVKEAKSKSVGIQKEAVSADDITNWIKENKELLTYLGVGTGVGGVAGLLSGMTGKRRRPIRNALTGMLLGALGGGAGYGVVKGLGTHQQSSAESKIIDSLSKLKNVSSPRAFRRALDRIQKQNPDIDLTQFDVPEVDTGATFTPVLKDTAGKALSSRYGLLPAVGAGVGSIVGDPWAHARHIETAVTQPTDSPLQRQIPTLPDNAARINLRNVINNPNATRAERVAAEEALNRLLNPSPAQRQLTGAARRISDNLSNARRGFINRLLPRTRQGWRLRPTNIQQDYASVGRSINAPRFRRRGAIGGAGVGAALALVPDVISGLREYGASYFREPDEYKQLQEAIETLRELKN